MHLNRQWKFISENLKRQRKFMNIMIFSRLCDFFTTSVGGTRITGRLSAIAWSAVAMDNNDVSSNPVVVPKQSVRADLRSVVNQST